MKNLNEEEIFKILNESNLKEITTFLKDEESQKLFSNYYSNLKNTIEIDTYETNLTSKKIVPWINPLLFHKNLNTAIDCLESYENLLAKELSLISYLVTNNFYSSNLKNINGDIKTHNELLKIDNIEKIIKTLNYRKVKKVFDLIEYTKASKLGGNLLFGINNIYNNDLIGIHRIREDLRSLLIESKVLGTKTQETIIPISAKFTKDVNNAFVVKELEIIKYEKFTKRADLKSTINSKSIIFDMTNHSILEKIGNSQLLRIGIEVIDDYACRTEDELKDWGKSYWNFELEDGENGFKLSNKLGDNRQIENTLFNNVQGSKQGKVIWSNNDSLTNINCNRKWKLNLLGNTLTDIHNIKDILLHFHISYIN